MDADSLRAARALMATRLGMWDWNLQTGETVFNDRWAEIVGYELAELKPTIETWVSLCHPDDLAVSDDAIERHLSGESEWYDAICRMRHKDGHWVWVHDRGQLVESSADGAPLVMVGTHEDVTERITAEQSLSASEQRFTAMFRDHDAVMLLVDPSTGVIVDANRAAVRFYGYSEDALRGMPIESINMLPPEEVAARYHEAQTHTLEHFIFPHRLADGRIRDVEVHSSPIDDHGRTLLFSIISDVTERRIAEAHLREAAVVFENIAEPVLITDVTGVVTRVNPAFCRVSGLQPDDIVGRHASTIAAEGTEDDVARAIYWAHRSTGAFRGELLIRGASGVPFPAVVSTSPITDANGAPMGHVGLITDIGEHVRSEQAHLVSVATTDTVTGLPNRSGFTEELERRLRDPQGNEAYGLYVLDVDRFKAVNDSYGYAVGDQLLNVLGARLSTVMETGDVLGRLGSDEFAILATDIPDRESAREFADRLQEALAPAVTLDGDVEVYVTACIGVAIAHPGADDSAEALQRVGAALNEAKAGGPGSRSFAAGVLLRGSRARLSLETRLRHAWEDRALRVFYQPQAQTASGRIVSAEALLRWPGDGEWVSPSEFVPLAEHIGLIGEIGAWVLAEACAQGMAWRRTGLDVMLSVNVSARQLVDPELPSRLAAILRESGFPASSVELEITESTLLAGGEQSVARLHALRAAGVRLAIDDFGTGYSSFASLRRFPLDRLKVDKSFVDGIVTDAESRAIAAAIIGLGHTLGLDVLAEGVETEEQRAVLEELGCDAIQGFLISPAVPAADFSALVEGTL